MATPHWLLVDPESPLPLHAQLAEQFTWLIARGDYTEGDRLPPVRSLADELAINFNTVRTAYKQLEAEGLVSTRRGRGTTVLGYKREQVLAARPNLRSFTIGVIIPAHTAFYVPLLNALEASTDPSLLLVCNAQQDRANGLRYLDQLVAKNVDGLLVVSLMLPVDIDLSDAGFPPIVFADFPGASGPSVVFDHRRGSELATQHMLEHGHERVGFIGPGRNLANVAPKYDGYEEALRVAPEPVPVGPMGTTSGFDVDAVVHEAERMLTSADAPTAIVAASDNHALGVMQAARELGIRIPDDLALIGNDDIFVSEFLRPALSTVRVPVAQMGEQAISILQRLIDGGAPPTEEVTLTPELVIRESCGCGRGAL